MPDINDPKKFRSANSILDSIKGLHGPSLKLGLIAKTLGDLDGGKIVTVESVREKLYDQAIALYEETDPEKRSAYTEKMRQILQSGRNYATQTGNPENLKYFEEFLQVLPQEKKDRTSGRNLTDKISAVAVYAGIACSTIYFSASSINGNVILDNSSTIFSQGAIAIVIGILVVAAFTLLSRKR
jgi:hypothetical protein